MRLAPFRLAKSTAAASKAWLRPAPRPDETTKKQLIAQTPGSAASASSTGRDTVRDEFQLGTSLRGPTCTQPTGWPSR